MLQTKSKSIETIYFSKILSMDPLIEDILLGYFSTLQHPSPLLTSVDV